MNAVLHFLFAVACLGLTGTAWSGEVRRCEPIGAPSLPEEIEIVEVPEGMVCTGISFSVEAWLPDADAGVPAPVQRPRRGDLSVARTVPDARYYARDVWPEQPVELAGTFMQQGRQLLRIRVSRHRWRGGSWSTSGTGVVEVAQGLAFAPCFAGTARARARLAAAVPPSCHLLILSPPDLRSAWEFYAATRRSQHPEWTIQVVGTEEVYRDLPFAPNGVRRNAAESLHAYVGNAMRQGTTHVLLGGMWCDAAPELPERYFLTGERLSLSNCVPGISASPHLDDGCGPVPSDLFYACQDGNLQGEPYPWDPDGDGVYLAAAEAKDCDCVADVVVGRFAPVPYDAGDGMVLTPSQLITNYAAKVVRGEGTAFAGTNRMGLASGCFHTTVPRGLRSLGRPHREQTFFDDLPNVWDLAHPDSITDGEWTTRETLRTLVVPRWPVFEVESLHADAGLFASRHATLAVARSAYLAKDMVYTMCRSHGNETTMAGWWLTRDGYAQATGLTLFSECAVPCHVGSLACTRTQAGRTYVIPSLGMAATSAVQGGALTGVYNASYGWGDEFSDMALSDGYSATVGQLMAKNLFENVDDSFGIAFLRARQQYAANYVPKGIRLFLLCEQFFHGDPTLALPRCPKDVELGGETVVEGDIAVVSASGNSATSTRLSGAGIMKVMGTLTCAGTNLELSCSGGVGGKLTFTGNAGRLALTGTSASFVGGVSNCAEIVLSGDGKTVDVTAAGTQLRRIASMGPGTNVVRCTTSGGLAGLEPIRVEHGWLRLETAEVFGASATALAGVTNGGLLWAVSPMAGWDEDTEHLARPVWLRDSAMQVDGRRRVCWGRHDGATWRQFELHVAGTSSVSSVMEDGVPIGLVGTTTVELATGGSLQLEAELEDVDSGKLVFMGSGRSIAPRASGLAGEVEVRSGAELELREVPLAVTTLVVRAGATLRIPATESGRHDVVGGRGTLRIESGAVVEDLAGNRLTGLVVDGSFFEPASTLRWKGGSGVWSDAVGWYDAVTGTYGTWIDGKTAIFDAQEGSCVSNDLPLVTTPSLVFSTDTVLTGRGIRLEKGTFTVPTNVVVSIAASLQSEGEISKYGDGRLELSGNQDGMRDGGIGIVEGTLRLREVTASGLTNIVAAAGTQLELEGRNRFTNAVACATLATNALRCVASPATLVVEEFRPLRGTLVPEGMELVVKPRELKSYAYWNMSVDGLLDYQGVLSLLYGRIEGAGTIRVEGLRSQSTSGATFGDCRLELASGNGEFPVYEDLGWGRGFFVFDGTTVTSTGRLEVSSAAYPSSQTILYVDDGGIAFDVPEQAELVFGDAAPTYLFGGSGGLVKRGRGCVRFSTVADQHDGPTLVEQGVYALATWTTTYDLRVSAAGVVDLSDPQPTGFALTNLLLEAGSQVKLCLSDEGADWLDVRGGVCDLPTNGVARLEVTIAPNTSPGLYGIFAADDFPHYARALSVTFNTPAGHNARCLLAEWGLVVQVRPPSTTILLR